jgi:hypothetical protein
LFFQKKKNTYNLFGDKMFCLCENENCRANTYVAASNGHIECLKYSHENGCPWDPETTYAAAITGHIECLKYAHKNGCPWHPRTTYSAACNGHLECLQYAHLHGCPWDPHTTYHAARNGYLGCLKYIFENCNIQWEDTKFEENTKYFSKETQDFIEHVKEDWKAGLNRAGRNIKSAQNKKV